VKSSKAVFLAILLVLLACIPAGAASPDAKLPAAAQPAYTSGGLVAIEAGETMLTVYGAGSASAVPDRAEIRFGLSGSGESIGEARQAVQQVAEHLEAALSVAGIAHTLENNLFTVWPAWGREEEKGPWFEAAADYHLVLTAPEQVEAALEAVAGTGQLRVHEVRYFAADGVSLRREALKEAVKAAEAAAADFARVLGKTALEIVAIEEVANAPTAIYPGVRVEENGLALYRVHAFVRLTCRLK
jgi:uncharacterized protein YggE